MIKRWMRKWLFGEEFQHGIPMLDNELMVSVDDVLRKINIGPPAMSSYRLKYIRDWLNQLGRDTPDSTKANILELTEEVRRYQSYERSCQYYAIALRKSELARIKLEIEVISLREKR